MEDFEEIRFADEGAEASWWRFRTRLSHGASQQMKVVVQRHLKRPTGVTAQDWVDGTLEVDWATVDMPALNDAMVLGSTLEWSFGAVTAEVLDGIPEAYCEQVLGRMNELYGGALPLAPSGSNGSQKKPSSPSPGRRRSRPS